MKSACLSTALVIGSGAIAVATMLSVNAAEAPLAFVSAIELPHVEGRIDHIAVDAAAGRLYVAALGNNTVEIVDTNALAHVASVPGFAEPQGIAVVSDRSVVAVANGRSGRVQLLNSRNRQFGAVLHLGDDADNVRYDAAAGRLYVGYGDGAIAAIDPDGAKRVGDAALSGHPESFQLERAGARLFVNVPDSKEIEVIDRSSMKVIATWPLTTATANFPMAIDESNHRLFVGCRRPAKVLVFDTSTGREVTSFDTVGDTDDLFYDPARKRVYVSGGEGFLDAVDEPSANHFARSAHVATAAGARTSLFVADQRRLYLAVPHRGAQRAEIRVYDLR